MARRPANTRATSSLQIGMTIAVRTPSARGCTACWLAAKRSRPRSSTKNPAIAVQKPEEIHAKRITKTQRMTISSGFVPL